jgi:hypothetical protein
MTTMLSPPTGTPPTSMTLSSCLNSRLTSLKLSVTWTTFSTRP